jgi:hypothetical protein
VKLATHLYLLLWFGIVEVYLNTSMGIYGVVLRHREKIAVIVIKAKTY